jgi:hypothetical protein
VCFCGGAERIAMLLPELETLRDYRLDENLTWEQLSAQMSAVGWFVSAAALFRHIELHAKDRRGPHQRTLHKVRKFLETVEHARALAARRPRPRGNRRRRIGASS